MKNLYTTRVVAVGGREGHVKSEDGLLELNLALPKELGGPGKATNPEQLFAAGYAACFENAIRHIARTQKLVLKETKVTGEVTLGAKNDGTFGLAAKLIVEISGLEAEVISKLVEQAHQICPYSNATRGNISVEISIL